MIERRSGILMHISSLNTKYGIGDFGQSAYDFVDFLAEAKQKIWQILPLGITGYGDSPYQSVSAFAGSPLYIDLDDFIMRGYLKRKDIPFDTIDTTAQTVDFEKVKQLKIPALRRAYSFAYKREKGAIDAFFFEHSEWLAPFCTFMTIKNKVDHAIWYDWQNNYKHYSANLVEQIKTEYREEFLFWAFTQYHFFEQWKMLKIYANEKGVSIMGDLPIYVSLDSVDTWANPEQFLLDSKFKPTVVAGCPPDAFSAYGQLWGNPIYNWQKMKEDDYHWWIRRMNHSFITFDIVRIDHFKGFESYWQIPTNSDTAATGAWIKGPGQHFFDSLTAQISSGEIVAEDLGFMNENVIKLRTDNGFAGMKILQFAFDPNDNSEYLPHNINRDSIVYTGTHDNNTVIGWMESATDQEREFVYDYLNVRQNESIVWAVIRAVWSSCGHTAISQMQDLLELPSWARMNTPSTLGGNWCWRIAEDALTTSLVKKIRNLTVLYKR